MPPKAAPPKGAEPPSEEPLVPLSHEERRQLFIKKLPELKAAGEVQPICEGMKKYEALFHKDDKGHKTKDDQGNEKEHPPFEHTFSKEELAQVQQIACRQLNALATTKDGTAKEKRELITKFHGVERFMNAISICDSVVEPLRGELYKEAMSGLCHLAVNHNSTLKENFGDQGGIEHIVAGMHTMKSDTEFHLIACRALHSLAENSFNAEKISAAFGVDRVIQAMEVHNDVGVQKHSCGALQNLSIHAENRTKIVQLGGIERIINAMTRNPLDIELAEFACGVLVNIGCATEEMKIKLSGSRGMQSMRGILQRAIAHPEASQNTKTYAKVILDVIAPAPLN